MIRVKMFAMLKDKAGTAEVVLTERPSTVADLLHLIAGRFPAVADSLSCGRHGGGQPGVRET